MALNTITAGAALLATYLLFRRFVPAETPNRRTSEPRRWLATTVPLALTEAIRTLQAQLTIF